MPSLRKPETVIGQAWRIVGSVIALIARAETDGQRWMKGSGYARKRTAAR